MTRTALYARYSSDAQRDASIEDQLRLCRLHSERQGWQIVDSYADRAISGASLLRPGIQDLIADAQRGRFDLILTESIDRLSRDQEDIAGLYKRMRFAGVRIVTLSEGEVSELHIGLKGTMGALYLKDLADKTRRGMRGRVEQGKAGGGNSYGYDVVKRLDGNGEPVRGDRAVNETEAAVVRRIFRDYADGKSSRTIALDLNQEGLAGPGGGAWGPTTIHGNPKRGTGILNNELYIGRLVWNRQRFIKNPDTGKRVSRLNPKSEWVTQDVPELRIVDQALWDQVKARQQSLTLGPQEKSANPLVDRRRPKYLLSGLLKCGRCRGSYSLISRNLLGCATARDKSTCDNRLNIRIETLEASVLSGLRTHLMDPALFKTFCEEFTREVNRRLIERGATIAAWRKELEKIERELDKAIDAILAGTPPQRLKDRMQVLEDRRAELKDSLATAQEPPALLHPNMAETYRSRISTLHESLRDEGTRSEAAEAIRSLVDQVVLTPEYGELGIHLRGDLAAMLAFAVGKEKPRLLVGTGSR
ncbi:resolvase [Sphingomonas oleivorans]|uniref:Resolvase n=1 Tax=Sphingomonas oleivorans TaxID=1735121 RepID=A0A2T5FY22_9SPHN|nr:recombinase family protein [Sphingomonas oleivorans]PTQ11334.1 resolvase [Sphingomonas oleivorans]